LSIVKNNNNNNNNNKQSMKDSAVVLPTTRTLHTKKHGDQDARFARSDVEEKRKGKGP